ncbi:hypothetical protein FRC10_004742 [Ceratobasidium sp. 414]|nr:hypothetical protein FRC10_004742 [Ceratobasidium sp. 414]
MSDNTQATVLPHPSQPPEFHSPPPPPGDPPVAAATSAEPPGQATQLTAQPSQYAPPAGPPPGASAPAPAEDPAQPSADPFSDVHRTAAQLQELPQHPDQPLPAGALTEAHLHSEPVPILPPRPPQHEPEQPPPPPRASFDQIPDHPAVRQSSFGRVQSPSQSVQRVAMTPVQPQPVPPPPQAPVLDSSAETLESDPAVASLHAMFPAFDLLVLQSVLEATGGDRDQAIDSLLAMSDPDYVPAQPQTTGGGAPNQSRQLTQTELDEEFARRLMLEEEQQAHGGAWLPRGQTSPHNVSYQTYQPRRSGEYQHPSGAGGGGISNMASDLQQQFRSFIGGTGGRGTGVQGQPQPQDQGNTGAGYQEQFSKFADTGKKTFNSIVNKVKQKMEEFDRQHPPDTQNMNRPPQSGHWSNWQAPNQGYQPPPQAATYAQSPAPAQPVLAARSPPLGAAHGTLDSNPYGIPPANTNTDAALPTSSGRWQYQPEPAAPPAQPQAPAMSVGAPEEPRRSIDAARLGILPKRPVSLMGAGANTRPAATTSTHATERDSDEESLEYVDRPMPGAITRSRRVIALILAPASFALRHKQMPLDGSQTTSPRGASPPVYLPVKQEPGDPPLFNPPPPPPLAATPLRARASAVKLEPAPTPPSSNAIKSTSSAPPSLPSTTKAEDEPGNDELENDELENDEPDNDEPTLAHKADETPNPTDEVVYTPDNALAKGQQMADTIGSYLQQLDLGSTLRKDVWLREVERCILISNDMQNEAHSNIISSSLKSQELPHTMIALCGATGAGKSSLLNAILDDNIVPTSGMRACTAVVTEIGYHDKSTIAAEIEFLALSEWKAELAILLGDAADKDGKPKRRSEPRKDLTISAVYPLLTAECMTRMTPDEIIAAHPDIQGVLGSTHKIESQNSEAFALEIAQYVDSKDRKRNKDTDKPADPALWPLIRLVRVRCDAGALKCGAVLVDLPGVADANLARSSIAKEYMKKCDRIWIVAPVVRQVSPLEQTSMASGIDDLRRAVDDKTAKDGNYDDRTITFIATKTDDFSCMEMIDNLGLDSDPMLVKIESAISEALAGAVEWKAAQDYAAEEVQGTSCEIDGLRSALRGYEEQLAASKASEPFATHKSPKASGYKKRKRGPRGRVPKRQCSRRDEDIAMNDHEDELNVEDDVIVISSDSDQALVLSDSEDSLSEGEPEPKNPLLLMQESLKQMIEKKQAELNALHERRDAQQKVHQDAGTKLAEHNKWLDTVQKEKSTFCSIQRNEARAFQLVVAREVHGEANNPDTFDPSEDLRDYNAIDLPVFTCSSRDYMRIKGERISGFTSPYPKLDVHLVEQIKGDGGPSCFANTEDTGVPALQQWCHELAVSAREQFAHSQLNNLATFLRSVHAYLVDVEGISAADRTSLVEMWESSMLPSKFGGDLGLTQVDPAILAPPPATPCPPNGRRCKRSASPSPPPDSSLSGIARQIEQLQGQKHVMLVRDKGKGVSFRLRHRMENVVLDGVKQLKQVFRDGIEERCRVGAGKAKDAAIETSDKLADSMHWGTYRATLRRDGEHLKDVNAELVAPMTREIASSWAQVFESDLFTPMEAAARTEITQLLKDIEDSVPAGLKDRCKTRTQATLKEVQVVTANILQNIKTAMTNEQKEISRCLTPHVKSSLLDGYRLALAEQGKGSVARQKGVFRDYLASNRDTIFDGGANSLFDKLDQAADSVGQLLGCALGELSEKVEVSMSTLWEVPKGNEDDVIKRRQLMTRIHTMLGQLEPWIAASKNPANVDVDMDTGSGVDGGTDAEMNTTETSGQPDN